LWLHVRDRIDLEALEVASGHRLFLKGPHQGNRLALKSGNSFGHYNPEFIRWFRRVVVTLLVAEPLRAAAQEHYDQTLRSQARAYALSYAYQRNHTHLVDKAAAEYGQWLKQAPTEAAGFASGFVSEHSLVQ